MSSSKRESQRTNVDDDDDDEVIILDHHNTNHNQPRPRPQRQRQPVVDLTDDDDVKETKTQRQGIHGHLSTHGNISSRSAHYEDAIRSNFLHLLEEELLNHRSMHNKTSLDARRAIDDKYNLNQLTLTTNYIPQLKAAMTENPQYILQSKFFQSFPAATQKRFEKKLRQKTTASHDQDMPMDTQLNKQRRLRVLLLLTRAYHYVNQSISDFAFSQYLEFWNGLLDDGYTYESVERDLTNTINYFASQEPGQCAARVRARNYGLADVVSATTFLTIFLQHKNLGLPPFIPIFLDSGRFLDWKTRLQESTEQAFALSRLWFTVNGDYLPIVYCGNIRTEGGGHAVSLYLFPREISRTSKRSRGWNLVSFDTSGITFTETSPYRVWRQAMQEIVATIQLGYKDFQSRHPKQVGKLHVQKCAHAFQREFGTCAHWSIIFLLHILSHFQTYKKIFNSSKRVEDWCLDLFKKIDSWSESQHTDVVVDISKTLFSYIKETILTPFSFRPPGRVSNDKIREMFKGVYDSLTPLLFANVDIKFPSGTIPASTGSLFGVVMRGMIDRIPMPKIDVDNDDDDDDDDEDDEDDDDKGDGDGGDDDDNDDDEDKQ